MITRLIPLFFFLFKLWLDRIVPGFSRFLIGAIGFTPIDS